MNTEWWQLGALENGSWIRTPGDVSSSTFVDEQEARLREEREAAWRRGHLKAKAERRARILSGPERAMKQYQNAIRKIGLMAVSEALGVG